ncbi:MAG: iron-containing alcohol dehydrogenase [Proteobacteria bacterium]|nr:iron-containing alcohol dehydrogenase [Pseudomonadota bacterium]
MEKTYAIFLPSNLIFGVGTVEKVGEKTKELGKSKALIITDKGIVGAGLLERVLTPLEQAGVQAYIFDQIEPNPRDHTVVKAFEFGKKKECELIIGLGGGSPIDAAKAVGVLMSNPGPLQDYLRGTVVKNPLPPFIAIPTTAGTGSEVTQFSVITDTERSFKTGIGSPLLMPKVAIVDPSLMESMPPSLAAATGMDALTHAIEAFVSVNSQPFSDAMALHAIRLIGTYLRPSVANGSDQEARSQMAIASTLAGVAFSNAGVGLVHAMSHPLGGRFDVPHGVANAILLPFVMQFNLIARLERFGQVAQALGEKVEELSAVGAGKKAVEAVMQLSADIGIPGHLSGVSVKAEGLPLVAADAMNMKRAISCNPRVVKQEEIEKLYREAL